MVSYYLIPWMTIAFLSYGEIAYKLISKKIRWKTSSHLEKKLLFFGLAACFPTLFFFTAYPYRGENYGVPVTSAVIALILLFLNHASSKMLRFRNWVLAFTTLPLLALPILLQMISTRFQLPSEIWPVWFMPAVWVFSLTAVGLPIWEHVFSKTDGLGPRSALGNVSILVVLAMVLAVFGEMEVYPLKARIREDRKNGLTYQIRYWNLNRLIWNEWGLMSLAVHEKISPLLSEADLDQAIQNGDLILARDTDRGKEIESYAKQKFPKLKFQIYPWNRWKTHAKDGAGNSLIGKAWEARDLSILWDHALMMRFER
jgi:hypothetical protein